MTSVSGVKVQVTVRLSAAVVAAMDAAVAAGEASSRAAYLDRAGAAAARRAETAREIELYLAAHEGADEIDPGWASHNAAQAWADRDA